MNRIIRAARDRLLQSGRRATDGYRSYSQEGEDRILLRLLEGHPPGIYVDIGAHHPTRFSNTALLYEAGWTGINVDPNPVAKPLFDRLRPRDTNVQIGIGDSSGALEYFQFDEPALNTFSEDRARRLERTTAYRLLGSTVVRVSTLAELLDTYLPVGSTIDILLVDVEGLDLEVLRSNDWARYHPPMVVVEILDVDDIRAIGSTPIAIFLGDLGYRPVAKTANSTIFVAT